MSREQKADIFQGAFLWCNKEGVVHEYSPSSVYILEDINDISRTVIMEFIDDSGANEFKGLWKKSDFKSNLQLLMYGNFLYQLKDLNAMLVSVQDIKEENIDEERRELKRYVVKCIEWNDNIMTNGVKEKKAYKGKTAQEIYKDMFSHIETENVEVNAEEIGEKLPIPLLFNPYWTKQKFLKYLLNNYVYGGPGKVITKYENEGVNIKSIKMNMYPLQYLMLGYGGVGKEQLKVEPDNSNTNGIKVDYYIHGPSRMDRVYKDFREQTMYLFNEMKGVDPSEDTMTNIKPSPTFDDNDDRGYVSPLFTNLTTTSEVTVKQGKVISESDVDSGFKSSNMKIECEPKPIAQHKVLNNFYQYYSQNYILECFVAPSKELEIGKLYYIKLPSRNQKNNFGVEDSTLSGFWLLSRIEHHIFTKENGGRYTYNPKCYFIRTGLENAPSLDVTSTKATDKSLQTKKEKRNDTASDKLTNIKSNSKKQIKDAVKSKSSGVGSGSTVSSITNSGVASNSGASLPNGNGINGDGLNGANGLGDNVDVSSTNSQIRNNALTKGVKGKIGTDNISTNTTSSTSSGNLGRVASGVGGLASVSTKLVSGKSAPQTVNNNSNIVTKAKVHNKASIEDPNSDVKVIDGTMTMNGETGRVNGIVKGDTSDGKVNGEVLANFETTENKIISGNVDGTYDSKTGATTADFQGDVIEDQSDIQIAEGKRNNDALVNKWFSE